METNVKGLICGTRKWDRKDKEPLYFLDWYAGEAITSFIERDMVAVYQSFIGQVKDLKVDIGKYKGKVQYKLLSYK